MKENTETGKKADRVLGSLDGIRRASPGHYFYTRLQARLENEKSKWSRVAGFISRPAFALSVIGIVLFSNTFILYKNYKSDHNPKNSSQLINTSTELPEEYNVAIAGFYDYETP